MRIEVWNIDDSFGVAMNGQLVISRAFDRVKVPMGIVPLEPEFGVFGGTARLESVRLYRDLHYLPRPGSTHLGQPIPEGEVFVLGDFSGSSEDSRDFGPVATDDILGRPVAVFRPLERLRILD